MPIKIDWNDCWRGYVKLTNYDMYIRLCECNNTKHDILVMSKAMYEVNTHKTPKECLDRMTEWVMGWNNQINIKISDSDYEKFLKEISKIH